jgi:hypothetical protein
MNLLDSTPDATRDRATTASADPLPAALCPRCKKPLTDPDGLGWCQACGFCRSLDDDKAKVTLPKPVPACEEVRKPQNGFVEFCAFIIKLPSWFWTLLLGVALFALVSYITGKHVQMTPLERALWCSIQIGLGIALILAAQLLALMRIAPEDERLSSKDAILSGRLWGLVFQRMPAMRVSVWLAGWGLTVIIAAIFLIGGLSHWMTYMPGNNKAKSGPNSVRNASQNR